MCIKHKESQILQLIRYEVMTCGSQNQTLYTSILYYNSNMLPLFHNVVFPGIELASQAAVLHSYAAKNGITPRKKKKGRNISSLSSTLAFLFQPPFCPFPCGQPFTIWAEIWRGGSVLRTNKGVQHLLVRDIPMKGKSCEHTAKVKAKVGPQPPIGTQTKLHQGDSKHMKNQAEKGIRLPFLCWFWFCFFF